MFKWIQDDERERLADIMVEIEDHVKVISKSNAKYN